MNSISPQDKETTRLYADELGLPLESEEVGSFFDIQPTSLTAEYRSLSFLPSMATDSLFAAPTSFPEAPKFDSLSSEASPTLLSFLNDKNNTTTPISISDQTEPPRPKIDISFFPLEKTSIYTDEKPQDIINNVHYALSEQNVVITKYDRQKFKFKCETYSGAGTKLHFVVRVYLVEQEEKGRYVIEFARRSGCIFQWHKIYNIFQQNLCQDDINISIAPTNLPFPLVEEEQEIERKELCCDQEMFENSLREIQEIFFNSDVEFQIDICSSFAALSKNYQPGLDSKLYYELILEFMNSTEPLIRLNALSCMANWQMPCIKEDMIHKIIANLSHLSDTHICREAARVLVGLSGSSGYSSMIKREGGIVALMEQCKFSTDKVVREHSRAALQNLVC